LYTIAYAVLHTVLHTCLYTLVLRLSQLHHNLVTRPLRSASPAIRLHAYGPIAHYHGGHYVSQGPADHFRFHARFASQQPYHRRACERAQGSPEGVRGPSFPRRCVRERVRFPPTRDRPIREENVDSGIGRFHSRGNRGI